MVDKINQPQSISRSRAAKNSEQNRASVFNTSDDNNSLLSESLLDNSKAPSKELKVLVKEKGIKYARRQLIREVLLTKFGEKLQGSSEFEHTFEKLNERIESIPELKKQYNEYLESL